MAGWRSQGAEVRAGCRGRPWTRGEFIECSLQERGRSVGRSIPPHPPPSPLLLPAKKSGVVLRIIKTVTSVDCIVYEVVAAYHEGLCPGRFGNFKFA